MEPALKPYLLVYRNTYYTGIAWLLNAPTAMRESYTAILVNIPVAQQFTKLLDRRQGNWIPVDDFKPRLI